jgi:hypothetical protein
MKKTNTIFNVKALAVAAVVLWAGGAQATSILNTPGGLYSTGVDASGVMSVDNDAETHYTVRSSTGTDSTAGSLADVASAYNYNGTYGGALEAVTSLNLGSTNDGQAAASWIGYNTSGSSATGSGTGSTVNLTAGTVANASTWVSLNNAGTGTVGSQQYYTYRTSFNLAGVNLSSVSISGLWASDNRGKAIYLNGTLISSADFYGSTKQTQANYGVTSLAAFNIAGFKNLLVNGNNFFDFQVRNDSLAATGLRVQFTTASVPEPESVALLAMGLVGMLVVRRRKA